MAVSTIAYNSESFVFSSVYDDSNRANQCLDRAIEIARETGEPTCVCSIYFNMGNYYFYYKDFASAAENYRAALQIAEQKGYSLKAWCAMSQLLSIAIEGGDDSAVTNDLKGYMHRFGTEPVAAYNMKIGTGLAKMKQGRHCEALACFGEASSFLMRNDIRKQFGKLFEDAKQEGTEQALNDYLSQIAFFKSCALHREGRSDAAIIMMDSMANALGSQTDKHLRLNIYRQIETFCAESGRAEELNRYKGKVQAIENIYSAARNSEGYRKAAKAADAQDDRIRANDRKQSMERTVCTGSIALAAAMAALLLLRRFAEARKRRRAQTEEEPPMEKYKFSNLADPEKDAIYGKVMDVMKNDGAIYGRDFTLAQLAKIIGVHERWVSQVINERCGMNFSALLNEYRVREVCHRMANKSLYGNLTLGAIGESVGFSSRTYFTKVFKKIMSVSPSDYYKNQGGETPQNGALS